LGGLVAAGSAAALLTKVLMRNPEARGEIVLLLPEWRAAPYGIFAEPPSRAQLPAKIWRFIGVLVKVVVRQAGES